jgi:uncharacterized protein YndB with AHSA1/START domain
MANVSVSAERAIAAPADRVYRILANYRDHHPRILPPAFSGFTVEEGGVGAGTVIRFNVTAGGRTQSFHQSVEEPDPGRVLTERDIDGTRVTTATVTPNGDGCVVTIETAWPAVGVRGIVERLLVPRMLRPIYDDELDRLDAYARDNPAI